MPELFEIRVYGDPQPKGDLKPVDLPGRPYSTLVDANKKLMPWMRALQSVASEIVSRRAEGKVLIKGPVIASCYFTMARPKSVSPDRWPHVAPDLDKLERAVFDALTKSRVWEDDGRVVGGSRWKFYPRQGPNALDRPGVIVRVRAAFPPPKIGPIASALLAEFGGVK